MLVFDIEEIQYKQHRRAAKQTNTPSKRWGVVSGAYSDVAHPEGFSSRLLPRGGATRLSLPLAAAGGFSNPAKVARQQKNRLAAAFLLLTIDNIDIFNDYTQKAGSNSEPSRGRLQLSR